jgi:hypothetical protein
MWNTLPCHLSTKEIFVMVARWGADQELDACCQYINEARWFGNPTHRNDPLVELRAARRPKPPTLKEQALEALREAEASGHLYVNNRSDTIRKALEALPND